MHFKSKSTKKIDKIKNVQSKQKIEEPHQIIQKKEYINEIPNFNTLSQNILDIQQTLNEEKVHPHDEVNNPKYENIYETNQHNQNIHETDLQNEDKNIHTAEKEEINIIKIEEKKTIEEV